MDFASLTPEQLEQLANEIFSSNKPLGLGPFILGIVVDALLCGILLMQCGSYISLSARDGRLLKATVVYVVTVNLLSTAFAWAWIWNLFVRNFGVYRTLLSVKYVSWTYVFSCANGIAIQMFFALRAWRILNRNRLFGIILAIPMLAVIGGVSAVGVLSVRYPSIIYAYKMTVPVFVSASSLATGDVLITVTILWYLLSWRGDNRRTNRLLTRLTRITFESQLPPTLVVIAIVAAYTLQTYCFILIPLMWAHSKLYGISLLHTLNMRPELAQVIVGTSVATPSCTTGRFVVNLSQTAQTGEPDVVPRSNVVGVSQSRSYFPALDEPQKPTVSLFDEESATTAPGDTLKVDVVLVASHSGSSDMEMGVVGTKSRLPDLESRTGTTD